MTLITLILVLGILIFFMNLGTLFCKNMVFMYTNLHWEWDLRSFLLKEKIKTIPLFIH